MAIDHALKAWHQRTMAQGGEVRMQEGGDPMQEMFTGTPPSDMELGPMGQAVRSAGSQFVENIREAVQEPKAFHKRALGNIARRLEEDPEGFVMDWTGGGLSGVIKPKGGQWWTGKIEEHTGLLRTRLPWTESQLAEMPQVAKAHEADLAVNKFVQGPLTKYIKNEMATADDPLRKLADENYKKAEQQYEAGKKRVQREFERVEKMEAEGPRPGMPPGTFENALEQQKGRANRMAEEVEEQFERMKRNALPFDRPEPIGWVEEQAKEIRTKAGYPAEGLATTEAGKTWEVFTDRFIQGTPAGEMLKPNYFLNPEYGRKFIAENPWITKVDPDTPIYRTNAGFTAGDTGFKHLVDELKNAMNPESGLPQHLRLTPEQVASMGMEKATRHVIDINLWRAEQKAVEDAVRAQKAAVVYKEYPESEKGLRWVELKMTDYPKELPSGFEIVSTAPRAISVRRVGDDGRGSVITGRDIDDVVRGIYRHYPDTPGNPQKELEDALKYEGEVMRHCVGGYCPDVESGASRIFSLRDSKGKPHATIEVKPNPQPYPVRGEEFARLDPQTKAQYREYVRQWRERHPEVIELTDEHTAMALAEAGVPPKPGYIEQIKGVENQKPKNEYIPYIQDFVKSQPWYQVRDFSHTDLIDLRNTSQVLDILGTRDVGKAKELQEKVGGNYITKQELEAIKKEMSKAAGGEIRMAKGGSVDHALKEWYAAQGGLTPDSYQAQQVQQNQKQSDIQAYKQGKMGADELIKHFPGLTAAMVEAQLQPQEMAAGGEVKMQYGGDPADYIEQMVFGTPPEDQKPAGQVFKDIGTDLVRGAKLLPFDVLGAPVDLATMAMRPFGYDVEKPAGGSEWLIDKAVKAGLMEEPTGSTAETASRIGLGVAGPGIVKGVTKAGKALKAPEKPITSEISYETAQEGPFLRVKPQTAREAGSKDRGIREGAGETEIAGGPTGSDVSQRVPQADVSAVVNDPNNFVRQAANQYSQRYLNQDYALPEMPPSSLAKQSAIGRTFQLAAEDDPSYKKAIFNAYGRQFPEIVEQSGAQNYDQLLEAAYRQLAKETRQQFESLPINMSFHKAGEGDYANSNQMLQDVFNNRHLYVFQGGKPHDFLNEIDPRTGLNTNEMFRAVHDFYGHAVHGNPFGPKGEEIAYAAHAGMFSPLARMAMAAETRGQNSFVNYTPLNAELKAKINKLSELRWEAQRRGQSGLLGDIDKDIKEAWTEFQFAPQKSLLLPPEFLETKYRGGMPDYLQSMVKPQPGTTTEEFLIHYSQSPSLSTLDPSLYGTGIKGEEASRLGYTLNPARERTYFYTGDPSQVRPEVGLGPYRYGAKGEGLYDIAADPAKLGLIAREANRIPFTALANKGMTDPAQATTDLERMIKEYGYQGLVNPEQGVALKFWPTPVKRFAKGGAVQSNRRADIWKKYMKMAKGGSVDHALMNWHKEQQMAGGGIAKAAKAVGSAVEEAALRLKTKIAQDAANNKTKPIASDKVIDNTVAKSAEKIAKNNPKLSDEEVAKRAERDAAAKLKWERQEKPALEEKFGELEKASYEEPLSKRQKNVPQVVEERIKKSEEFLSQPTEPWTPPPEERQAFQRSLIRDALEGFPGVEQTRFPRYSPARADLSYIEEIYGDPRNRSLIEKQIKRGLPLGGETFYASLYPVKVAAMERGIPEAKFNQWVYENAPASARNSILNEMAVGQFLRDMKARGIPINEKTVDAERAKFKEQYGVGLPLMPIHREGVKAVIEGGQDLREMVKADIPTNYKIPTYGTQKAGDFGKSMVLDVHESAGQTLGSPYHPYFVEQGGFGPTEYGLAENKMLDIAQEMGIPGGMAQAGRWFGGGELTGLKSPRGDALDLLEKQTAFTLQGLGIKPTREAIRNYVLNMIETGEGVLMPYYKSAPLPDVRTKKSGGLVKAKLKKRQGGLAHLS